MLLELHQILLCSQATLNTEKVFMTQQVPCYAMPYHTMLCRISHLVLAAFMEEDAFLHNMMILKVITQYLPSFICVLLWLSASLSLFICSCLPYELLF